MLQNSRLQHLLVYIYDSTIIERQSEPKGFCEAVDVPRSRLDTYLSIIEGVSFLIEKR